jgi:hypothetical protein
MKMFLTLASTSACVMTGCASAVDERTNRPSHAGRKALLSCFIETPGMRSTTNLTHFRFELFAYDTVQAASSAPGQSDVTSSPDGQGDSAPMEAEQMNNGWTPTTFFDSGPASGPAPLSFP